MNAAAIRIAMAAQIRKEFLKPIYWANKRHVLARMR
jgi:hypothetical protein